MNKIIEGAEADLQLQNELESSGKILQDLDSWVNHSPDLDLHSIDLFKSGQEYFLMVNFGLVKTVWELSMDELRQLRNKDDIVDVVSYVDRRVNEPVINR